MLAFLKPEAPSIPVYSQCAKQNDVNELNASNIHKDLLKMILN